MKKRSVLTKILVLVLLALLVPAAFAGDPYCWAPVCIDTCPAGTYDCTTEWATSSWDNFYALMALWWNGYTPLVCCAG